MPRDGGRYRVLHAAQVGSQSERFIVAKDSRQRARPRKCVRLAADPKTIKLADIPRVTQPELSVFDGKRKQRQPSGIPDLIDLTAAAASTSLLQLMEHRIATRSFCKRNHLAGEGSPGPNWRAHSA